MAVDENISVSKLKNLIKETRKEEPRSLAGQPAIPGFLKSVKKEYFRKR